MSDNQPNISTGQTDSQINSVNLQKLLDLKDKNSFSLITQFANKLNEEYEKSQNELNSKIIEHESKIFNYTKNESDLYQSNANYFKSQNKSFKCNLKREMLNDKYKDNRFRLEDKFIFFPEGFVKKNDEHNFNFDFRNGVSLEIGENEFGEFKKKNISCNSVENGNIIYQNQENGSNENFSLFLGNHV